ncbi:hypothetical protein SGCZBJ_03890 [Caulobacter zeae]|uniref:Uncharacterized protein n=1 Tax=Caulobacter zeae TaxID=2055137 RepID=A0A2N5DQ24_9CAUL|nr:hypothetical protein [Caulobacter zeae]PLR28159.1 hypothetical protein SGCZBJ_03890 [Caulobacter zeae]
MSRLTNDARVVLEPLLFGDKSEIFPDEQDLIAQWAIMTAMTIDTRQGTAAVTDEERHLFRGNPDDRRRPVDPDWRVFIGRHTGDDWNAKYQCMNLNLSNQGTHVSSVSNTLFALGRAVFLVMSFYDPPPDLNGVFEFMGLVQIFPSHGEDVIFCDLQVQDGVAMHVIKDFLASLIASYRSNAQIWAVENLLLPMAE